MTKRIKVVGARQPEIRNIGTRQPRVEPDEVAKALGAERCAEIPERFKAAAGNPLAAHHRIIKR